MGPNISAAPRTDPLRVRNINFTREPCSRGFDRESKPPVREMICNLPGTRRPSWKRRTAGVASAKHVRGERHEPGDWTTYGMEIPSIGPDHEPADSRRPIRSSLGGHLPSAI